MKSILLVSLAAIALAAPAFAADDMKAPAPAAAPAKPITPPSGIEYTTTDGKTILLDGAHATMNGKPFTTAGTWRVLGGKTLIVDDHGLAAVK